MRELMLYSTLGCHLCEDAKKLAQASTHGHSLTLREMDIAEDPALMEEYGLRIPVLKDTSSGAELGWPFDSSQLRQWLNRLDEG